MQYECQVCSRGVAKVFTKETFELFQRVTNDLGTFDIEIINPRAETETTGVGLGLSRRIVALLVEIPEQGQDDAASKLSHSEKLIENVFSSLERATIALSKSSTLGDFSLLLFAISKRNIFAIGIDRVTDLSDFSVAIDSKELRRMNSGSSHHNQKRVWHENSILDAEPPLLIDHLLKLDGSNQTLEALKRNLTAFVEWRSREQGISWFPSATTSNCKIN